MPEQEETITRWLDIPEWYPEGKVSQAGFQHSKPPHEISVCDISGKQEGEIWEVCDSTYATPFNRDVQARADLLVSTVCKIPVESFPDKLKVISNPTKRDQNHMLIKFPDKFDAKIQKAIFLGVCQKLAMASKTVLREAA